MPDDLSHRMRAWRRYFDDMGDRAPRLTEKQVAQLSRHRGREMWVAQLRAGQSALRELHDRLVTLRDDREPLSCVICGGGFVPDYYNEKVPGTAENPVCSKTCAKAKRQRDLMERAIANGVVTPDGVNTCEHIWQPEYDMVSGLVREWLSELGGTHETEDLFGFELEPLAPGVSIPKPGDPIEHSCILCGAITYNPMQTGPAGDRQHHDKDDKGNS